MRPEYQGVDLDIFRRPGVPRLREPQPWPNSRWPIPQQEGEPAAHRMGKPLPPVFATALPPIGLSGALRTYAYRYNDDRPTRWLLLLAADRLENAAHRLQRLTFNSFPRNVRRFQRLSRRLNRR